jgi:hypothetical protein
MSIPILLTAPEQKQLRLQARRSVGRVSERIHYVLLFSRGHAPDQIAALYEVDERTVSPPSTKWTSAPFKTGWNAFASTELKVSTTAPVAGGHAWQPWPHKPKPNAP